MKKKFRLPLFYVFYFTFIILFVIALLFALKTVTVYLSDYESSLPEYEAQRVFETYYASGDYSKLVSQSEHSITTFETEKSLERYLEAFTKDKTVTYSSITTGLDDSLRYIVKADDVKFSSFTLVKSGSKTEKGFDLYELGSLEVYSMGPESIAVAAPRGYSVYVNETAVDGTWLTGEIDEDISCKYMPEGVDGIATLHYRIDGLYEMPESVRVCAPDGRECDVRNEIPGVYHADFLYDDSLLEPYTEYVTDAAQAIAAYMQFDGKFSEAAKYIDPDSDFYVNLRTSETYFVISHSSYSFEDVKVSEFYRYDENTFSCRISFTHVLKRTGSKDYRDYIDMTLFLRRVNDQFLIYDRYNH